MNEKEVREIRRRFRPDRDYISAVYGCYVNENKKIVSQFEETLGMLPAEESARYLGLLKKSLSGALGKNLLDITFSTQQVMESEEHRLLYALRQSGLKDPNLLQTFYERIMGTLQLEENYLILLTHDVYTVPYRTKDDQVQAEMADEEYDYLLCSICPVKLTQPELSYYSVENRFHSSNQGWVVSAPELGFLFPAFDDRAANLYGALYYTKSASENHQEFIDTIFHTEPPMPAAVQKETFQTLLTQTLQEECSLEVIQSVHEQLCELMEQHKESKQPEPLLISKREIGTVLTDCGVSDDRIQSFVDSFDAQFGEDAALPPANVIDQKKFEIKTPDVVIRVNPERSDLIETRIINGSKYILICADGGVEVNGINVRLEKDS